MNHMYINSPAIGIVPPQAVELEQAVIGALLLEKEAFPLVESLLQATDFYQTHNQTIYQAILNLDMKHHPIDILTVVEELKKMGELENIGGPVYIAELLDKVASAAHIEHHARIIAQKSKARKLISLASDVITLSYDQTKDVDDTIEYLEKCFTELTIHGNGCHSVDMATAIKQTLDYAAMLQENKAQGIITAIPTHIKTLTEELDGGWRAPDLIVLGGRPSMGKTQHALAIAKAAATSGIETLFISIEMTQTQLISRFLLEDEAINSHNLHTGQMSPMEWEAIDYQAKELQHISLHIADHHEIRYLNNIKSEARRMHRQGKLKMMIIDYLQLIKTNMKFGTRDLEIGYITGELKSLCKELNIPIIILAQLSRKEKNTKVKDPQLEDLRESGNIEQDADIVLFIHKPDFYDPQAEDLQGVPWKNRGKLILSKYRQGARNDSIIFYHDNNYKKISHSQFYISSQFPTVRNFSEPEHNNDEVPF